MRQMKDYEPYFGYILIPTCSLLLENGQKGRSALETFSIGKNFKESSYTHAKNIIAGAAD